MSKGPGHIERAIEAIFDTERDNAFTVEELCERIYGVSWEDPQLLALEPKHRVAVTRAAHSVGRRRPEIQHLVGGGLGRALVFFRHDEVLSYAMARLKAADNRYCSHDPRFRWIADEKDLREKLAMSARDWPGAGISTRLQAGARFSAVYGVGAYILWAMPAQFRAPHRPTP